MLKLYKRIKRVLHYHEAWAHGAKITEHWGIVGERGRTAERNDASWRTGKPAKYLAKWLKWYRTFPQEARTTYGIAFREPKGWSGFYKSLASSAEP